MKIAINGIGVAGPALAWWLKKFKFEPVLFERAPRLRTGGYIIDFWGVGYDIAEKMGILPELKKRGYKMEALELVNQKGRKTSGLNTKVLQSVTQDRFISIARSEVSAALFHACQGVEARFGTFIEAIEPSSQGVLVGLSDGSQEKFDLVVGADGLHSQVRSLVFGPEERFEKSLGVYVSAFTLKGYQPRKELTYISHAAPMRQVSRASLRNDETLFLFTFASDLVDSAPQKPDEEKALLRKVFGEMSWEVPQILSRLDEVDDFYFDRVSQIHMEQWTQDRVALLGDAAACISLLGGEGTGLAITEAYVLANELSLAGGDFERAFQNYQERLMPFLKEKQKSAKGMLFFFCPKNRFDLFLRNLVIKASSIPLLSKFLLGRTVQDHIALPDYEAMRHGSPGLLDKNPSLTP